MIVTAKNLREAADILEAQPVLTSHDYVYTYDGQICYCMMGAIAQVKNLNPYEAFDQYEVEFLNPKFRQAALAEFAREGLDPKHCATESSLVHDTIAEWNDGNEDSPEVAAAKLRAIADRLEPV